MTRAKKAAITAPAMRCRSLSDGILPSHFKMAVRIFLIVSMML